MALVSALLMPAARAESQALIVLVTDSLRGVPIEGAMVSLLDKEADLVSMRRTPTDGRVRFPAGVGHYALQVESRGYQGLISNWIAIADTDTLEVIIRLRTVATLPEVAVTAYLDSIAPLLPLGVNPRTGVSRLISPTVIERNSLGARDFVDVLSAAAVPGVVTALKYDRFFGQYRCLASSRGGDRPCALVFVNNMRTGAPQAIDLATPENLDFAVWLPPEEAGVLYGTDASAGVLLIYTKDFRRARSVKPPF